MKKIYLIISFIFIFVCVVGFVLFIFLRSALMQSFFNNQNIVEEKIYLPDYTIAHIVANVEGQYNTIEVLKKNDAILDKKLKDKETQVIDDIIEIPILPKSMLLPASFVSQAPYGDWSEPYDEACEEASIVMAVYAKNQKTLTKNLMDKEIHDLVKWQNNTFGYWRDTTAVENSKILRDVYGVDSDVVYNPTIELIKSAIAEERLVLAHLAGREIGNPHFHQPGPLYHLLVIRGYDESGFITNDPGTRHGEKFHYNYSVLMSALHDWNNGDVSGGTPVVLMLK